MQELRFDGRTAIVTGAGGDPSLGRAHARLLAARGANVVVNDIGRSEAPGYEGEASAEAVAAEIRAAGGKAVASARSVADEQGAAAVVQTAIDAFGGIDILVNNAGISVAARFNEMTSLDTHRHVDINLMGTVWMCRAAWPHMQSRRYGRIVNTGSGAFAGMPSLVIYGASKGGIFSLSRGLATEGEPFGIKVNTLNPGGFTRMLLAQQYETSPMYEYARNNLPPELVSPAVAFLSHESCWVTGECFDVMGGEVRRTYLAQTQGFADRNLTVETIAQRWGEVMGEPRDAVLGLSSVDSDLWHIRPYDSGHAQEDRRGG
jgi:NAD(P)-dependent dehydrogenase (short-subunit alcohol dehydrogenase family)